MKELIEQIEKNLEESPPFYPIILHYEKFNSKIFDCITILENHLSKTNRVYRTSTMFLEYYGENKTQPSYYDNLFNRLHKVDFSFESIDKIVIIDSFFPIDIKYDINSPEFSHFIINFCNEFKSFNNLNTKLILCMKTDQMKRIPHRTNLRRYRGVEHFLSESNSCETIPSENKLLIKSTLFPTKNLTSVLLSNPLYWFIEKELIDLKDEIVNASISIYNDPLINVIKNFNSIDLSDFPVMFKEIKEKSSNQNEKLKEIINHPNIRDSKAVRIFNIINIFRFFYKCEDKLEILIPDKIKEILLG